MKQSSIFLTRTGFLYQDKVAIHLFLIHFLQRDLEEFYIDYPLEINQKSLDVRLVTKERTEKVYEIKSGSTFKKKEEEILDAILDLYKCFVKHKEAKQFLIISHGFKPTISHIWDILMTLQKYKILNSDRSKQAAKELFSKLNSRESTFTDIKSMHKFVLSFVLDDPFSDQNTSNSENDPLIEKTICQEIDTLLSNLKADSTKFEYPTEVFFQNFIYLCSSYAGRKENLLPIFIHSLLENITVRRFSSVYFTRPSNIENKKEEIKKEVENEFYKWWEPKLIQGGNQSLSTI
jgi:hypothetical protein